ncbi:gamma-glutamylcyclotransferase family protein [Acanthopleuribacter pedis]|uniref:gamma-glutamylcyclotransferase family protein n=1 Tax=Acanthopleuribacter pedis TaxID=442870 RepID=UPI002435F8D4|nr:gamma-glutamylcyclotransferase [Acanthopleuribacter pedis]
MGDTWSLFVYGTLKRGLRYHAAFCSGMLAATKATAYGELYDTPHGYPMMTLPARLQWIQGCADRNHDMALNPSIRQPGLMPPHADQAVHGEVLTFPRCAGILQALDDLEDFHPQQTSMYHRVMAPVWREGATSYSIVWLYLVAPSLIQPNWPRMRDWPGVPF